jgi:hypothetical protein
MAELRSTETVETTEDLISIICWDDDEDPMKVLAGGAYQVCGGEWRHEGDERWRFWEDPIVAAELACTERS